MSYEKCPVVFHIVQVVPASSMFSGVPRGEGGWGVQTPTPRNSEGSPKSCQTQPDCENC